MEEMLSRLSLLLDDGQLDKLRSAKIAIFGLGGVGGYALEALARSGIGSFDLIDDDIVTKTNLNRQILATYETLGEDKVQVAMERVLKINPLAKVTTHKCFFLPEKSSSFPFASYDYVIDAIDTITAKIAIVTNVNKVGGKVISALGCGNRLDPTQVKMGDIYETFNDPLARVLRRELRKEGIGSLKVVYSTETPFKPRFMIEESKKRIPGSSAFVPSVAGIVMAYEVVRDLLGVERR